jgi:hypothetical protein
MLDRASPDDHDIRIDDGHRVPVNPSGSSHA